MKFNTLLVRFNTWRTGRISPRNLILILALVVGLVSGLSAVILKNTVHYFYLFLTRGFDVESFNLLYLAYPLIGIALTVLYVRLFVHEDIS
ncbi:MAG: chloride channel protein, partial [Candidatus Cloacimonetes bacterium]|nr:chloride channel protein [Candidatus Cloacimonadota bacterium]